MSAMDFDAASLSVSEASRLLDEGALSSEHLLRAVFARIDAVDGVIHSYLRQDRDAALAAAHASTQRRMRGGRLGPLDGIPFAVKDNIYTAGLATTAGSRVPQRHDPALHATLVSRLQDAGAILVGKLNTWEYGTGTGEVHFDLDAPPACNPWNPAHYTGGSSSGAGAAVAGGTAMFAIGTDTGGSVRLPAAACGVVGLKPTFGRISRHGVMPNCWSFDTPGPLAASVEDAARVYQVIAGHDPHDPASLQGDVENVFPSLEQGVAGLRIGYLPTLDATAQPAEAAIAQALSRAHDALRAEGADMRTVELPIAPADYRNIALPINRSESFSIHERDYLEHRHLMGRALREKLEVGMYLRAADYLAAQRSRRQLVERTNAIFDDIDVLLLPMTSCTAPPFSDAAAIRDFTTGSAGSPFSLSGHPALSLPAGFTDQGLPVAVQLAAGFKQEAMLLRVARALERRLALPAQRAKVSTMLRATS